MLLVSSDYLIVCFYILNTKYVIILQYSHYIHEEGVDASVDVEGVIVHAEGVNVGVDVEGRSPCI